MLKECTLYHILGKQEYKKQTPSAVHNQEHLKLFRSLKPNIYGIYKLLQANANMKYGLTNVQKVMCVCVQLTVLVDSEYTIPSKMNTPERYCEHLEKATFLKTCR
jgi:hypothetical protein